MLEIDGSYGEGGGQILRYAAALSALTKKPVEIKNIRANRPVPGIRPQHHTAISCIKSICKGAAEGLSIGSSKLTFMPGEVQPGEYKFDIGTAGSITLVFQACILSSLTASKPITIKLTGGTDVKWAPTWDYFTHVFLPLIEMMGVKTDAQLIKRGYYPKGGGEAFLTIHPVKKLQCLQLEENQGFNKIEGIVHIANLPDHIGKRMKHSAMKIAVKNDMRSYIHVDKTTSFSPGTGITLWSRSDKTVLGSTFLGEKGVSSEKIGEDAANQLINEINMGASVDTFAIDQILPYMVLAGNESVCIVRELSNHIQTNMWLASQFFKVDKLFEVEDKKGLKVVKVNGAGFL
ncbi:MAG: RNA 3'-terminal phosphate cyclase [Thermoplasmatales archaeon]|nr:MAG: RNA 3'-terminal phosphate cyclase [Thermoplasmatales archaeon]